MARRLNVPGQLPLRPSQDMRSTNPLTRFGSFGA